MTLTPNAGETLAKADYDGMRCSRCEELLEDCGCEEPRVGSNVDWVLYDAIAMGL